MRNPRITLTLLSAMLCLFSWVHAQPKDEKPTKEEKKYALRSKEVDDEIMGVDDPFFKDNTVPAAYANASAVVLAKKIEIFSDLKSKVKFSLFYKKEDANNLRHAVTIREKIKIQDKNSLNEYSELSFNKISRQSNYFRKAAYTFVGITLIKPDGTKKKIDVDEEAVNAQDEDEKDKYKLAIPGLQVGDIIDMYSRVEKETSSDDAIDPFDVVLTGDYPIVKYSFNTKINNGFAVIYSAENGAATPKQSRDEDFIYLKAEQENISRSTESLWLYERREFPVFKINIFPGSSSRNKKSFVPQKGEVLKGVPKDWIDADLSHKLSSAIQGMSYAPELIAIAKDKIKTTMKQRGWKKTDKDSLINYIYYYGRFMYLYDYMSDKKIEVGPERNSASTNYDFYNYLIGVLHYFDIDFDFIMTVPRSQGTIHDVVSTDDFMFLLRAKGNNDIYLFPPTMFSIANSFPSAFEGQEAYVFKSFYPKPGGAHSVIEKLPYTKPGFNLTRENLDLSIDMSQPMQLKVERTVSISGNPAYDNQVMLSSFEQYVDEERARMGEKKFSEELLARSGKKRGAQLIDEYGQAFAAVKRKREDFAKEEAESSFETKLPGFSDFRVLKTGNRHDQREFMYAEKFQLDGLVKKAGNNYIINIGSMVTGQLQVKTEDRTRSTNIDMPYARSFEYRISFSIPEGYAIEGADALNKSVENETGGFTSKATIENGKLLLTVTKTYNHYYEPLANWAKMLQFLDAAYDLTQQKVLLKKL